MGISGRALRLLDASFDARSHARSTMVAIKDDLVPPDDSSCFVNAVALHLRGYYPGSDFLSDCDFVFGATGRILPGHAGEL